VSPKSIFDVLIGCNSVHILLMNIVDTAIPALLIIEPKIFGDARGLFVGTFQSARNRSSDSGSPCTRQPVSVYLRRTVRTLFQGACCTPQSICAVQISESTCRLSEPENHLGQSRSPIPAILWLEPYHAALSSLWSRCDRRAPAWRRPGYGQDGAGEFGKEALDEIRPC
jgi:hypothetical protein